MPEVAELIVHNTIRLKPANLIPRALGINRPLAGTARARINSCKKVGDRSGHPLFSHDGEKHALPLASKRGSIIIPISN